LAGLAASAAMPPRRVCPTLRPRCYRCGPPVGHLRTSSASTIVAGKFDEDCFEGERSSPRRGRPDRERPKVAWARTAGGCPGVVRVACARRPGLPGVRPVTHRGPCVLFGGDPDKSCPGGKRRISGL
jgi:hypothetical protein